MANIKSAKKRIGVIERKTLENRKVKNGLKAVIKPFYKALEVGELDTAKEKLALAEKKLKQAAAKGVIHSNAADRKVSRMTLAYNKAKAE